MSNGYTIEMSETAALAACRILLARHNAPCDEAALPAVDLLLAVGEVVAESGSRGHDYEAVVEFDSETYLATHNNAWTAIYASGNDTDADERIAALTAE